MLNSIPQKGFEIPQRATIEINNVIKDFNDRVVESANDLREGKDLEGFGRV